MARFPSDVAIQFGMLDLFGAIVITAVYALLVGTLVGLAPVRGTTKIVGLAVAMAWGGLVAGLGAVGRLAPVFAFGASFAALLACWFLAPRFRTALATPPLQILIALNAGRAVVGTLFLLLGAQGRLSDPFASLAGWGDVLAGALAIPLALRVWRQPYGSGRLVFAWNALGAIDIFAVLTLGLLSAPGFPFRTFTEEPGTQLLTELPWEMIPAMPMPIYLIIHLTIAANLLSRRAAPGA